MWVVSLALSLATALTASNFFLGQPQQQITALDRGLAELMLSKVHETLKQNYYDPSLHGINIDERYKHYLEPVKNGKSIQSAYRVIGRTSRRFLLEIRFIR
jgi:hypothetical protein